MQVKYIVYYPAPKKPPRVALWLTSDGSMTHVKYINEHQIQPQLLSSLGYTHYSPFWHKYRLEHYQDDVVCSLIDIFKYLKQQIRDRLLVKREIYRNTLLKDPRVKQGTYKDLLLFQKAKKDYQAY